MRVTVGVQGGAVVTAAAQIEGGGAMGPAEFEAIAAWAIERLAETVETGAHAAADAGRECDRLHDAVWDAEHAGRVDSGVDAMRAEKDAAGLRLEAAWKREREGREGMGRIGVAVRKAEELVAGV
jgi:hypothetical protein